MAKKKEIVIEFKGDTEDLTQSVEEVESSVDGLTGQIDSFTNGAVSGFTKGAKAVKGMVLGMKTLKAAIIATGVGALVVGITAVITAVSRLQGVQDKYKQFTAGLGAVLDVLGDTLGYVGQAIIDAFSNPKETIKELWELIKTNIANRIQGLIDSFHALGKVMKGVFDLDWDAVKEGAAEFGESVVQSVTGVDDAINKAKDSLSEFGKELEQAAKRAADLEKAEQRLRDVQISQTVNQARRNKLVAEARIIAEDQTKTIAERTKALQEALALEDKNLQEQLANAREEARIIKERNSLSESSREDRKAEAEALARVYELETQSIQFQRSVFTRLQALKKQQAEEDKKRLEEEAQQLEEYQSVLADIQNQILEDTLSKEEKELKAVEDKYQGLIDRAKEHGIDTAELEEQLEMQLLEIRNKYREEEQAAVDKATEEANRKADEQAEKDKKREEDVKNTKIAMAKQAISIIGNVLSLFGAQNEAQARRRFNINKALGIADATVDTAVAVVKALKEDGNPLVPGSRFLAAAAAGAAGAAQIASIASTQFQGGGSSGGARPTAPSVGGGGSAPTTPQLDFSFLGNGAGQDSIQAYVLETDVSNSQQANTLIQDQATL
jgi:membrane protein involved in colicin uptake